MHGGYGGTSGGSSSGGTVSALSGSDYHESQKQWDWLEEVLSKSSRNNETVRIQKLKTYRVWEEGNKKHFSLVQYRIIHKIHNIEMGLSRKMLMQVLIYYIVIIYRYML